MRRVDVETERRIIELYCDEEQKPSLRKVAKYLGIDSKTAWLTLVRNNVPRRRIGAPERYTKTDFSGNAAERARINGFLNDCGARLYRKQIGVNTSTAHPAQIRLFYDFFHQYGHVTKTPMFDSYNSHYNWGVRVYLSSSFAFLLDYKKNPEAFLAEVSRTGNQYNHIAGVADAESWVGIQTIRGRPQAGLNIYNTNRELLEWTKEILGGNISSHGDVHTLRLNGALAVETVRKLPVAHAEKVASKELIVRHYENGGIGLRALWEYQALRRKIDKEVRLCRTEARLEWIKRHGRPHRLDPDQTIPPELALSPSFFYL